MAERWAVIVAEPPGVSASVLRRALADERFATSDVEVTQVDQLLSAARSASADVAVIGPTFPRDGLVDLVPQLLSAGTRTLILSDTHLDSDNARLLLAGASGFLLMSEASLTDVRDAVFAVASGGTALHPAVVQTVLERWRELQAATAPTTSAIREPARPTAAVGPVGPRRDVQLSARERDILRSMVDGLTNRGIAKRLGVAEKTVEAHKSRLYAKLGARNQAHATRIAVELGLLE